jgi:lysophospholipase L1-like esterase
LLFLAFVTSACVWNISDREEPGPDGDVTGERADCSAGPKEPLSSPQGAPGPRFAGRFSPTGQFAWSGSEITARFKGSGISVTLELPPADPDYDPAKDERLFTSWVDGKASLVATKAGKNRYELAKGLDPNAVHEVVLHREFEAAGGLATFHAFEPAAGGELLPPRVRTRRIEIIGDSISCGYGVLGADGACPFTYGTQRHSLSYGALAARTLDAELTSVCVSGKGLTRNENGDDGGQPTRDPAYPPGTSANAMPQLYGKLDPTKPTYDALYVAHPDVPDMPNDPAGIAIAPSPDTAPQVVVVNLGTNDFNFDVRDDVFVATGIDLLQRVRSIYPEAHLFFALSPMLSDSLGAEIRTRAAAALRTIVDSAVQRGDKRAYYMQFIEQRQARDGLGCSGHPSPRTHELAASQLVQAIQSKLCW